MSLFDLPSASVQSKNNEWYTPAVYIEAARQVMGDIDLDPASCEVANRTVRAKKYYTIEDDGLQYVWSERVWLNPPYSKIDNRSGIEAFINKLVAEYQFGSVTQAIVLCTVRTEAAWYQPLWNYPICFPDHILHFYKPNGMGDPEKDSRHGHFFGTSFAYLGSNESKFIEVFSQFGRIVRAINAPKPAMTPLSLWEVSNE